VPSEFCPEGDANVPPVTTPARPYTETDNILRHHNLTCDGLNRATSYNATLIKAEFIDHNDNFRKISSWQVGLAVLTAISV